MPEAILEPDLPIVDPHHHMWDRPTEILRNLPPSDHGFMDIIRNTPRYLLTELLADLKSGHNIRGTIYMECGAMYRADGPETLRCVGETEFVNGVAAMTASGIYGEVRACAGIVGHVDLRIGAAAEDVLRSHIAAGHGRFRGIRQSASYDADPGVLGPLSGRATAGLYLDAKFREGFKVLRSVTTFPPRGKSGPLMRSMSWAVVASGLSIRWTQARTTSPRLCGGMLVARPTAMPETPLTSRFGNCAGNTTGSSVVFS